MIINLSGKIRKIWAINATMLVSLRRFVRQFSVFFLLSTGNEVLVQIIGISVSGVAFIALLIAAVCAGEYYFKRNQSDYAER